MKISGAILVHNNERTIAKAINSIKDLIDELIVVDDYSTDNTIKIIKKIYPKAKIYRKALNKNFATQRNFALSKVSHDWVLFIDSDEKVSKKLKKEILTTLKHPKFDAYVCEEIT